MNVKPGQLAIIIKSAAGNEGKIGEVKRLSAEYTQHLGEATWEVEFPRPIKSLKGKFVTTGLLPDSWLKPVSGIDLNNFTKKETKEKA